MLRCAEGGLGWGEATQSEVHQMILAESTKKNRANSTSGGSCGCGLGVS